MTAPHQGEGMVTAQPSVEDVVTPQPATHHEVGVGTLPQVPHLVGVGEIPPRVPPRVEDVEEGRRHDGPPAPTEIVTSRPNVEDVGTRPQVPHLVEDAETPPRARLHVEDVAGRRHEDVAGRRHQPPAPTEINSSRPNVEDAETRPRVPHHVEDAEIPQRVPPHVEAVEERKRRQPPAPTEVVMSQRHVEIVRQPMPQANYVVSLPSHVAVEMVAAQPNADEETQPRRRVETEVVAGQRVEEHAQRLRHEETETRHVEGEVLPLRRQDAEAEQLLKSVNCARLGGDD